MRSAMLSSGIGKDGIGDSYLALDGQGHRLSTDHAFNEMSFNRCPFFGSDVVVYISRELLY